MVSPRSANGADEVSSFVTGGLEVRQVLCVCLLSFQIQTADGRSLGEACQTIVKGLDTPADPTLLTEIATARKYCLKEIRLQMTMAPAGELGPRVPNTPN